MSPRLPQAIRETQAAEKIRKATERAVGMIPPAARKDLTESLDHIRKVRSVKEAVAVLEAEIEHLLGAVLPVFVRYPAPIRRTRSARLLVAGAGLTAAAVEQLSELGALLSGGSSLPVSVPTAMGAALAALAVEAYVAASLRVRDLQDAGLPIETAGVAAAVGSAMAGQRGRASRVVSKSLVKAIAKRIVKRTGSGLLLPVVGAAYGAWDAQATIVAIRRMELPEAGEGPRVDDADEPAPVPLPSVVAHADWSTNASKRWVAEARLDERGRYLVSAPRPAGPATGLDEVFGLGQQDTALVGFDFPIGLPIAYAAKAGIDDFPSALQSFGTGRWASFFEPARDAGEISIERPFFPAGLAAAGNAAKLRQGLGLPPDALYRACDRPQGGRRRAAALFLTQGQQQAGKAAIVGWRDVLQPSLSRHRDSVHLWPFDGRLAELLRRPGVVVAETYPAELYRHLGLTMGSGRKTLQDARKAQAPPLLTWAERSDVALSPELSADIEDGFGGARGDDRFDAVVGLFGMLNVLGGGRPDSEPVGDRVRRVEGWMLGLAVPHEGGASGEAPAS